MPNPQHTFPRPLLLAALLPVLLATGSEVNATTIDRTDKYAWSETSGWLNFAATGGNVNVLPDHLEGYVWAENIGWIRLGTTTDGGEHSYSNDSATSYGVNRSTSDGSLSGYAWSDTAGWINFGAAGGSAKAADDGAFSGYAWGDNIGWIKLAGTAANGTGYRVTFLDTTAPAITRFSPANESTQIELNSDLSLSLNEVVTQGSGTLAIVRRDDDVTLESIEVDSPKVTVSADGKTITIDPDATMLKSTAYYVTLSQGAFTDAAGNGNAAISDAATWQFTSILNIGPIAEDDHHSTAYESEVLIDVLLNDRDPDGDTLSIVGYSNPRYGSLVSTSSGFRYIPGCLSGTDTFDYRISDGSGGFEVATVTITVAPPTENRAPCARALTVVGTPVVGRTLSAMPGQIGDPNPRDLFIIDYQWSSSESAACTELSTISGADDGRYTITGSELGQYLCLSMTLTDSQGLSADPVINGTNRAVRSVVLPRRRPPFFQHF